MKKLLLALIYLATLGTTHASDYTKGLSIWFDKPNNLDKRAIWFGCRPDLWAGEKYPELPAGGVTNPDQNWESTSLPIGNGSIGANIMGSIEAERITFLKYSNRRQHHVKCLVRLAKVFFL